MNNLKMYSVISIDSKGSTAVCFFREMSEVDILYYQVSPSYEKAVELAEQASSEFKDYTYKVCELTFKVLS